MDRSAHVSVRVETPQGVDEGTSPSQLAYLVCILTRVSLHRSECIKEYRHIKEERNWRFCEACWAKQHKKVGRRFEGVQSRPCLLKH